jgi:hypothetical protein
MAKAACQENHGHRGSRGRAEDDQSGDKRPAAAIAIAESSRGKQQDGEDQQVRVDDPLKLGLSGSGTADQVRNRDVQRRHRRRDRTEGYADDRCDDQQVHPLASGSWVTCRT